MLVITILKISLGSRTLEGDGQHLPQHLHRLKDAGGVPVTPIVEVSLCSRNPEGEESIILGISLGTKDA